jgi:ribonuclease HI
MQQFRDGRMPHIIFCDGACSGNPGPGGWGTVVATSDGQVTELAGGDESTTNNRMELIASIRGLEFLEKTAGEVDLYTDSAYVIRGITAWVHGWRRRGWKTAEGNDVANRDLWERLATVASRRGKADKISWLYVRGHTGVPGNERVDELAVAHSQGRRPALYRGPLKGYGVALLDIPESAGPLPEMREKQEKKAAHSYLSLVNGVAKRHGTWGECERRVKGVSGAKFKKALSAAEEQAILATWRVRLDE